MLDFKGKIAIVTGAGRGIGRATALVLAKRGAKILVNDYGGGCDTISPGTIEVAQKVVDEITEAGGTAIADATSVGTVGAADIIAARALEAFGRIDILVDNAGGADSIAPLENDSNEVVEGLIQSNLLGAVWLLRRIWPLMKAQGYGRIVNMSSSTALGMSGTFAYATAKGGIIGLTNVAAVEGREHGILVNAVLPTAYTRGAAALEETQSLDWFKPYTPELVGEGVAYLCSAENTASGEMYRIGGGMFSRYAIYGNTGLRDWHITAEKVAEQIAQARDMTDSVLLADTITDVQRAF